MAGTTLANIPVNLVRENKILLRKVNRESEDYQNLVASVRDVGVLSPISVREIAPEEPNGPILYAVIDGAHRFNASKDAGKETIPAQVMSMDDAKVEEAQIIANVHKIETKPVEYTQALTRILERNPLMTEAELAALVHKSPAWIRERFSLLRLTADLQTLVDEGSIKLVSAYALAKLPEHEQEAFRDRAITVQPGEFTGMVNTRLKELRAAAREGRNPNDADAFVPTPSPRSRGELVEEQMSLQSMSDNLKGVKTPEDGYKAALAWVCQLDGPSIAQAKAKHEQRIAERNTNRQKAEAERAARRLERATKILEEAKAEVEAATSAV